MRFKIMNICGRMAKQHLTLSHLTQTLSQFKNVVVRKRLDV